MWLKYTLFHKQLLITLYFQNYRKKNPKIHMEPQKTLNTQSNIEKKLEAWHILISNYITQLQ